VTERQLQESIIELATVLGWLSYHTFDSRRSTAGFPDLVLVRGSRILFAELKDAKGARSLEQDVWAEQLERVATAVAKLAECEFTDPAHIGYRLWRPADWHSGDIERELRIR
jgi:hypothetical protein